MKYCACWQCDDVMLLMLIPIPMSFTCIEQIYCALATNLPAVITFTSIFVLSCSVYASKVNMIIYNPFVDASFVLMAPYLMIQLTRPYYHLFRLEQPGLFHQMRHKGLTSVTIG